MRDRSRTRWVREGARCAAWLAGIAAVPGILQRSPVALSVATSLLGLAFVLDDLSRLRSGALQPITLFAFSLAATGFANAVGLAGGNDNGSSPYFLYAVDRHLVLASLLLAVGGSLTIMGFRAAQRMRTVRILTASLPAISGGIGTRPLLVGGAIVAVAGIVANLLPVPRSLGTITAVVLFAPNLVIFTLARYGEARNARTATRLALLITLVEAVRALLFSYLRSSILAPLFAFAAGSVTGARSLRVLRGRYFLPIYVAAAAFVMWFAALGRVRVTVGGGAARLAALIQARDEANTQNTDRQALLVRLTSFNQLSQVGRVAEEDGFQHGRTLEYLGYAFIPRFLWPEKPKIAKGAWFAYRIGLAYIKPDGSYSNSINMTVPGELYLNFGWTGVVVGCLLFGAILATLWIKTDFWAGSSNVLGTAFGFYLLWVAVGLGADLQIIVTLVAMYLIFAALATAKRLIHSSAAWSTVVRRASHRSRVARSTVWPRN